MNALMKVFHSLEKFSQSNECIQVAGSPIMRVEKMALSDIKWLRLLFHTPSPFLLYWLTRTPQLHLVLKHRPPSCLPGPPKPAHRNGEGELEPNEEEC
jgi:hypothetical protein